MSVLPRVLASQRTNSLQADVRVTERLVLLKLKVLADWWEREWGHAVNGRWRCQPVLVSF